MSTNISKMKRSNLLAKINEIKKFVEESTNNEITNRFLNYLADLEKSVNGKKFGLVFEEHKEKIDEILEKNTPVYNEEEKLLIDNGGLMNFLIEGDNLAALNLLVKTHREKVDLIYIVIYSLLRYCPLSILRNKTIG